MEVEEPMGMLTSDQAKAIAEELRITRYKSNGKMAFEYIYNKYKHLFEDRGGYDDFLYLMDICATFFASQGEKTKRIREMTHYVYV